MPTWEAVKAEAAPAVHVSKTNLVKRCEPEKTTRFLHGLPFTMSKRLRNAHIKADINAQHPADLIWNIWQELGDLIPDTAAFSAGEYQKAAEHIARNPSRATVETGLTQLIAWGIVEICEICDLATQNETSSKVADLANLKQHTRPAVLYRFLPIAAQVANFQKHYTYLLREYAFKDTPDNVQPEWCDPADLDLLEEMRQPVYQQYASERAAALGRFDRDSGYLESALERIQQGRYIAHTLPAGELRNSREYRKALQKMCVPSDGSEAENAYMDMYTVGCSRSTLPRLRAANGVITVPREKVIPVEQVTDYQRDCGLVLAEHDNGTATVKAPSAQKFANLADESERAAYAALCERQKRTRQQVNKPVFNQKPDTIPADYSEAHKLTQFDFTPGAEQIARYDPETGERYPAAALFSALADRTVQTREQGEVMTLTSYSMEAIEERERHEQETASTNAEMPQANHAIPDYGRKLSGAAAGQTREPIQGARPRPPSGDVFSAGRGTRQAVKRPAHTCHCGAPATGLSAGPVWECDDCRTRGAFVALQNIRTQTAQYAAAGIDS
jgi:hypothetical protein